MLQCLISLESCCQVTRGRPLLEGELALHSCINSTNPMPDGTNNLQDIAQQGAAKNLQEHTSKDEHYDVDIASEVLRSVSVLNPRDGETRISAITRHLSEHSFLPHHFSPPTDNLRRYHYPTRHQRDRARHLTRRDPHAIDPPATPPAIPHRHGLPETLGCSEPPLRLHTSK
jgi:hypothetical protein